MSASPEPAAPTDALGITADAKARVDETLDARRPPPRPVARRRAARSSASTRSTPRRKGSYLYDADGRAYLDFHTGEGFASLGHNHPDVREVLQATLAADLADGVQIHYSPLAGMLAEALARRLPGGLDAVFFASTGAEAVDSAMKFARAATGRPRLLSCDSSFHGVTLGPLSLVGDEFFKEGFGPLLPGCARVPFGDLDAARGASCAARTSPRSSSSRSRAAMVTLPPERLPAGRAGALPPLRHAVRRSTRSRPGSDAPARWFALEHWGLEPDFVLVGKALSGGYMPVAAMVTTREIFQRAVGTLERCYVHQSTYGRNRLSMAAGLATLRIIERDGLVEHAARVGRAACATGSPSCKQRHEMIERGPRPAG